MAAELGTNAKPLPYQKQDYKLLRKQCLESETLFKDQTFPAGPESLGFDKLGPKSPKTCDVIWKRPTELHTDPKFIPGEADRSDVCQGHLGDCWLLAALASLTLNLRLLCRVVPQDQSFSSQYAGIFHFKLWQYGQWFDVVVDDLLPTRHGKLMFVHSTNGQDFWSSLLEKAYAKLNGSYEALSGGLTIEGFEDFTGGITKRYNLTESPSGLFHIIRKALKLDSLLSCSINKSSELNDITAHNLVRGHAYSITGAKKVHYQGSLVKLVRIRNPWGHKEWTGAWGHNSEQWNGVDPEVRQRLNHHPEGGEFWMSYADLQSHFSYLSICNLTPDALIGDKVHSWGYSKFEGTFCSNSEFFIRLDHKDDCIVLIGLMVKDTRKEKRLRRIRNSIGFTIYKVPDENDYSCDVSLGLDFLSAGTLRYTRKRELTRRFKLPPGEYRIVPTTFQQSWKESFILRVFTEKEHTTRLMAKDV